MILFERARLVRVCVMSSLNLRWYALLRGHPEQSDRRGRSRRTRTEGAICCATTLRRMQKTERSHIPHPSRRKGWERSNPQQLGYSILSQRRERMEYHAYASSSRTAFQLFFCDTATGSQVSVPSYVFTPSRIPSSERIAFFAPICVSRIT